MRRLVVIREPDAQARLLGLRARLAERKFRPQYDACPGCGAEENAWCKDDCSLIDRMDYR